MSQASESWSVHPVASRPKTRNYPFAILLIFNRPSPRSQSHRDVVGRRMRRCTPLPLIVALMATVAYSQRSHRAPSHHANDIPYDMALVDPSMVASPPHEVILERPHTVDIAFEPPPYHHHHDEVYDNVVFYDRPPPHVGDLPPHQHLPSTLVDEYGRPVVPPAPRQPTAAVSPIVETATAAAAVAPNSESMIGGQSVFDDEPFLHQALDHNKQESNTANVVDHDLGELSVRESGDDLTVHVGKNKVKTETVATITATITATDEHEDSYIKIHRDAHEASAGHEHDHLDQNAVHLDSTKHDALDQQGLGHIEQTPAPDLSFLQDVEVLKVLFPWLDKHSGAQATEGVPSKALDHVVI